MAGKQDKTKLFKIKIDSKIRKIKISGSTFEIQSGRGFQRF